VLTFFHEALFSAARSWPFWALKLRNGRERSNWNRPPLKGGSQMKSENIKYREYMLGGLWICAKKNLDGAAFWRSSWKIGLETVQRSAKDEVKAAKQKVYAVLVCISSIYTSKYIYICFRTICTDMHFSFIYIYVYIYMYITWHNDINIHSPAAMLTECERSILRSFTKRSIVAFHHLFTLRNPLTWMVSCRKEAISESKINHP
jgi:hypothetical protein